MRKLLISATLFSMALVFAAGASGCGSGGTGPVYEAPKGAAGAGGAGDLESSNLKKSTEGGGVIGKKGLTE